MALNQQLLSFLLTLLFTATFSELSGAQTHDPKHIDPTLPPVLETQRPKCSIIALQQDFTGTVSSSLASANYTQPPECPFPWTRIVLELSVSASGINRGRTAAVWLDGAEVLRTATPVPYMSTANWKVEKDITRYAALLRRLGASGPNVTRGIISMMLDSTNDIGIGVYSANVSLHFYRGAIVQPNSLRVTAHPTIKRLYRQPADLIIPVSNENGFDGSGFWLKVENDTRVVTSAVKIPMNSYRAVLEIFVSYHGDDENWYMNPLKSTYLNQPNSLKTAEANGGLRQLYATIDGKFVGGRFPFMVISPGSVNPFFWSPVTAIAAFDMPSYDLDITPFLSMLLDGQMHEFGFGVHDALPYWLVSANLHVWVDIWSDSCEAGLIEYTAPPLQINRNADWGIFDGQSEVNADGQMRFAGWVSSSKGNLTTIVEQKIKFKSQVELHNRGALLQVQVNNKAKAQIEVRKEQQTVARVQYMMDAPLQVLTSTVNAAAGAKFQKSRLFHQLEETVELVENQGTTISTLIDRQDAEGSALMRGVEPIWGSGNTRSQYKYRDENTCYLRQVDTAAGAVVVDTKSPSCGAISDV